MEKYEIANNKDFMAKLLKSSLFDSFEVREVSLKTAFTSVLDGTRNKDYFLPEEAPMLSHYLTWAEMKKPVYDLIQGTKSPSYFKIVLSTSNEKTAALSPEVSTFFLNIEFQTNKITCTTAVSYKGFTLDKSPDKLWDTKIKDFLFKYHFI